LGQRVQRLGRVHPRRLLDQQLQFLDETQLSLLRGVVQGTRRHRIRWETVQQRLFRLKPSLMLRQRVQIVRDLGRRLRDQAAGHGKEWRNLLGQFESRLRLLSPENVLARGYSITMDAASGKVIRAAREVRAAQKLRTRLHQGEVRSVAEKGDRI
jgi:exodeoxyribonuclease VII large subunit